MATLLVIASRTNALAAIKKKLVSKVPLIVKYVAIRFENSLLSVCGVAGQGVAGCLLVGRWIWIDLD